MLGKREDRLRRKGAGIEVPALTLDEWMSRRGIEVESVDFVHCDAQGAEGHVLQGAESVLARGKAVWQIEVWPRGLAALGTEVPALCTLLEQWFRRFAVLPLTGWSVAVLPIARVRSTLAPLDPARKQFLNLLLFPTDRD